MNLHSGEKCGIIYTLNVGFVCGIGGCGSVLNLKIGEHVHYGTHGVCRVCGKESKTFGRSQRMYYALQPVGRENILLYLPEDADPEKVHLRPVLSREEILELIRESHDMEVRWISDSKQRKEVFSGIIRSGDARELFRMLKTIRTRQAELTGGKQLPMSDQELRQSARRQLYSELSYVLGIEEKDVFDFIMSVAE